MKSANALLCVPRGDGELVAGQELPAILIGELPAPPSSGCFHAKVWVFYYCVVLCCIVVCCVVLWCIHALSDHLRSDRGGEGNTKIPEE